MEADEAEDVMDDAEEEDRLMGWLLVTRVCRQSWGSSPTLSPASRQRRLRSLPSPATILLTHAAILLCCVCCVSCILYVMCPQRGCGAVCLRLCCDPN